MISKEKLALYKQILLDSPKAKRVQKWLKRGIISLIVIVIIYQLYDIGWNEVLKNLPTNPLFYLIFIGLYLTLPTVEVLIYRQIWKVKKWRMFKAFLTKRVYNDEVMGYSGEFFLFIWGRKNLNIREKDILKNVRDNNILSAISSNTLTIILVGILVYAGFLNVEELFGRVDLIYIIAGVFIFAILVALIVQFRKYLFSLELKKSITIFSLYFTRFIIHNGLMILLWSVAIPGTPLSTWLIFVAVMIVVSRIPFLPSRDLVFMMAGIEMSKMFEMTSAAVAGMLLVYSVLKKVTNLILFLIISTYSKDPEIQEMKELSLSDKKRNTSDQK